MDQNNRAVSNIEQILLAGYMVSVFGLATYTYAAILHYLDVEIIRTTATATEFFKMGGEVLAQSGVIGWIILSALIPSGVTVAIAAPIIGLAYVYHTIGQQTIRCIVWALGGARGRQ